jgi:pyruvate, water dikinase
MDTAEWSTAINPLLWLEQLQDSACSLAGDQLVQLGHMLQSGLSVRSGFVISDAVMQECWTHIVWSDQVLQDFPYLRLNFSSNSAAQLQSMAQTLQDGILALPMPPKWEACWQSGIEQLNGSLLLTPYPWTSQADFEKKQGLETVTFLKPFVCESQVESLWYSLKLIWADLFQAGHLFVFDHLDLHPETMHLSVLVQSMPSVQAAGWMQVLPAELRVQVNRTLRLGADGQYYSDAYTWDCQGLTPSWQRCGGVEASQFEFDWLRSMVLEPLHAMRTVLEKISAQLTVNWILLEQTAGTQLELLGLAAELPFPMPAKPEPQPLALQSRLLGKGLAASPGYIVAPAMVIEDFQQVSPAALQGSILVTRSLEPAHLAWLQAAAGLVCETGGVLSHGAVMARESGFPAVVGVKGIASILKTGQWITLSGDRGEVYAKSDRAELAAADRLIETTRIAKTATQVMVNLSDPARLGQLKSLGADGLGLVRGEWLLLDQFCDLYQPQRAPWLQARQRSQLKRKLRDSLGQMAYALKSCPVFYRAVDLYAADWSRALDEDLTRETNPAIGLRGSLRYLSDTRLLDLELEALQELLDQGATNLRLVLPFVRSPQEVERCRQRMERLGLQDRLPLWIMAEVPSVLFSLEAYRRSGTAGIAIGFNDLTQLLLGIDRDHLSFKSVLAQQHTTVTQAITQLVQSASALSLPTILCGLDDSLKLGLEPLIESGLSGVSVEIGAVKAVREAIAQAEQHLNIQIDPVQHSLGDESIQKMPRSL